MGSLCDDQSGRCKLKIHIYLILIAFIANSFFQRIIALTSHVCLSVRKCDILFQTLSTVSHATSPSPQFFSKELAQITLVLFLKVFIVWNCFYRWELFRSGMVSFEMFQKNIRVAYSLTWRGAIQLGPEPMKFRIRYILFLIVKI